MRQFLPIALFMMFSASPVFAQMQIENAFPALSFVRPVDLQHPRDGSDRLFVVEQAGTIRVFANDHGVAVSEVFLDIRTRVDAGGNEEGLLGLAFHPRYADNGYFYVNYTATSPDRTVIARFQVSDNDPDLADSGSETVLLEFTQPYSNHNGGQLAFGPDGYLYIGTGDGGSGGDPQNNAQNNASLLGKILRLDVDNPSGGLRYGIPQDNPFKGNTEGLREEIWAYGLRNPWRFSFDPSDGRLWAGDVGQNRFEEIDIIEGGRNYGWRIMEAGSCYNPQSGCDQEGLELPVWSYGRSEGQSITGGHVYRGSRLPELYGTYVYADFVSGSIWGLKESGGTFTNELLLRSGKNVASFGVDDEQELYLCSFDGSIYRMRAQSTHVDEAGSTGRFTVSDAYPNPSTVDAIGTVRVTLPDSMPMRAVLYDVLGRPRRLIADGMYGPGAHTLRIPSHTLVPGVYVLSVTTPSGTIGRRLVIE